MTDKKKDVFLDQDEDLDLSYITDQYKHLNAQKHTDTELRTQTFEIGICPRCNGNHENIKFNEFSLPINIEGQLIRFWTTCPTTEEPIILINKRGEWVR